MHIRDVKAFITNNRYGPQISAFGKILFGRVGLDINYLEAETTQEEPELMAKELRKILENIS